jgi:aminoglycoside phosphotransferase
VTAPVNPWASQLFVERSDAKGVHYCASLVADTADDVLERVDTVRAALASHDIEVPQVASRANEDERARVSFEPLPGLVIVEPGNQVEAIVRGLGRTLAAIHGVEPAPVVAPLSPSQLAELATVEGTRRTDPLDRPYERQTPERLVEIVRERIPAPAEGASDVLCHGAFGVNAVVVAGNDSTGIAPPVCAVVADRHLDLATLLREAAGRLPAELMPQLLDAYGAGPDSPNPAQPARLDWFDLARTLAQPQ